VGEALALLLVLVPLAEVELVEVELRLLWPSCQLSSPLLGLGLGSPLIMPACVTASAAYSLMF
jgi:hypothetical protein